MKSYPPGVPARIDLDPQETLVSLLENSCRRFPERPAFTNFGVTLSYRDLDDLTRRFASWLQNEAGFGPGERIALMMPNLLQYPVALFGALRAGMVVVNVNPLYTARELQHQLVDSGARAIVVVANAAATLARVIDSTPVEQVVVTGIGDLLGFPKRQLTNFVVRHLRRMVRPYQLPGAHSFDDLLSADAAAMTPARLSGAELACLQYTGGTTGLSRGAMLSHGNLVANVHQINAYLQSLVAEDENEIMVTALPLYHIYALTCNCFCYTALGGRNLLISDPRDTSGFVAELRKWPFTAITGVNTLYQSLIDHPDFPKVDFSSLKLVSAGGMAVMEYTAREWARITGRPILEGYGLSETSPVVTSNRPDIKEYTGTIGLPVPNTEVSLRDERGEEVGIGEAGELCVRGPQVTAGYWNDPQGTAAAMTSDGYFRTGDIATVDGDGYFRIVDRKKDMILVSGFNVYPNEVENVLTLHPDIVEAAVIGVPGPSTGELVKAFVVRRPGSQLTAEEIREYCRDNLAAYKVPRLVEFRDELPKSNVGKILRRALRESDGA